ncbi:MAG: hypothetical protein WCA08_20765 [Desulfoferrobacter sp.]
MKLDITIEVWKKRNRFIAKCVELDFVSQGATAEEAKKNLLEVVQIQFEEMAEMGTLDEYMAECGYQKNNGVFVTESQMVVMEKHSLQVA